MSPCKRHTDPSYLLHTINIKAKAVLKNVKYRCKPYELYQKAPPPIKKADYLLQDVDGYHSFKYFISSNHAQQYYQKSSALISEVITLLVYHNEHGSDQKLVAAVDKILRQAQKSNGCLIHAEQEGYDKFDMKKGAVSSILHGKLLSLLIRVYRDTKDGKYLSAATGYKNSLLIPILQNGPYRTLENGAIWLEEYPSSEPSMVLNGHLFCLIALAEYAAIATNVESLQLFEKGLSSAVSYLSIYWQGEDLLYSMYHWDLCNVHYLGIMTYQFEHLYLLTSVSEFQEAATRLRARCPWPLFDKLINGQLL